MNKKLNLVTYIAFSYMEFPPISHFSFTFLNRTILDAIFYYCKALENDEELFDDDNSVNFHEKFLTFCEM